MKKVLATLLLLLTVSAISFGQGRGPRSSNPEESARNTVSRLDQELKLSPAQKDSVYAISLASAKARQELFQQGQNGDREQTMTRMRELRQKTDERILSVLTADQQKAYQKMTADRPSGGPRRNGP